MDKGGNRDNAANSGSRTSNWNNPPTNSNWSIGLRVASDNMIWLELGNSATASFPRPERWSAIVTRLGEYKKRFGERRVVKIETRTDIKEI